MRPPPDTPSQPAPPPAAGAAPPTLGTSPPAAQSTSDLSPPDTDDPGAAAPPLPAPAGRYRLGEEIGRGGMGAVLRARDPALGRELAVKVLRGEGHDDPELLRRFVEEAQVCSQLQHPGIVPVHDLGRLEDGRPFFAMKLIRGRTLADLLRGRRAPADDLPRFLTIFEQVCQAVAYAHSKGVIHRDLKPANVMVGAFGEVQVMDWGLAKVLRPRGGARAAAEAGAGVVRTVRSASGEGSRDGQAMGTPAYMAPEQARGEVEGLDERCDVFGLGAILCVILTGAPPFAGGSAEAHARAMRADLGAALARLGGCGADAEPIALAQSCLAAEAAARPRDAGSVAAALTRYQGAVRERLRQAELGRARAEVRATEERKRRRLTAVLAAAALAALVALAAGGLWWQRQRDALRKDVEASLAQALRFRKAGNFEDALALLEQARQRLGAGGPADLRQRAEGALADTALARRLDDARQLASTLQSGVTDFAEAEGRYAAALAEAGQGPEGEDAAAVAARVRASGAREEVVAALDDWAGLTTDEGRREWLLAAARAADPDPDRDRLRQPELWRDKAALERLVEGKPDAALSPQLAAALSRALRRHGVVAVPLLQEAQARRPDDYWLNFVLAVALYDVKRFGEAARHFQAALAMRPQSLGARYDLGLVLLDQGQLGEAVRHFEAALQIDPQHALVHYSLANALYQLGRLGEAAHHYEEEIRLNPKFAWAHVNLGNTLQRQGQVAEAIRHYREALQIDPKLPQAHYNFGEALGQQGKRAEAVGHYQAAVQFAPDNAVYHNALAIALERQGRVAEAIRHYRQAAQIDPKDVKARYNLGLALQKQGQRGEAIRLFEEALRIDPQFAPAHQDLGLALDQQGRRGEALRHLQAAVTIDPRNARGQRNLGLVLQTRGREREAVGHFQEAVNLDPENAQAYLDLGTALHQQGRVPEAARHYEQALRLGPRNATAHYNLGNALYQQGRLGEAARHYQEALDLDPQLATAHVNLGNALYGAGRVEGAICRYEWALRVAPDLAPAHFNLGNALVASGRAGEAVGHYEQALRADPRNALAHSNRGEALRLQGRFEEALASLRRGHELGAKQPGWTDPSGQWVRAAERLVQLDRKLDAVLRGEARPADATERLSLAEVGALKKRYAAAARLYADAFAADPKLAGTFPAGRGYNAACCAALAAAGRDADAPRPDAKERARLRGQALAWLRAELAVGRQQAESAKAEDRATAQRALRRWQQDADLAGERGKEALAALPEAEQAEWEKLWAEVAGLLRRLDAAKPAAAPAGK